MRNKLIFSNVVNIIMLLLTTFLVILLASTGMVFIPIVFALFGYSMVKRISTNTYILKEHSNEFVIIEYFNKILDYYGDEENEKAKLLKADMLKYRDSLSGKKLTDFKKTFKEFSDMTIEAYKNGLDLAIKNKEVNGE